MPGYRTHASAALGATILFILVRSTLIATEPLVISTVCAQLIAGFLGGLFPDIDIKSKGMQLWYALLIPLLSGAVLSKYIVWSLLLASLCILPPLLPHRGITHNPWFDLIAPLIGPLLVWCYCPAYTKYSVELYACFVLGAFSHLVLDYGPRGFLARLGRKQRKRK